MAIVGTIGAWLIQQLGGSLFTLSIQHMLERMGLGSLLIPSEARTLLDEYLQKMTDRLDEDRIAKIYAAFSELKVSPKSSAKQALLEQALDRFHDVVNLPQQGTTGGYQNSQLRCLAFLGMAATHQMLNDPEELIAENMVEAVYADHSTALRFLEKSIVGPLLGLKDRILVGHTGSLRSTVFSPDGETLASGGSDNTLRLWDALSGDLLRTYTNHQGRVNSVAFSPDGKTLASGSNDRTILLWDVEVEQTGHVYLVLRKVLTEQQSAVASVAFSPNGNILVSGNSDGSLTLWDVSTGQLKETLKEHGGAITSVAFSSNGKIIASGSSDQTLRLWQLEDGEWQGGWQRILRLEGHIVVSLAFSPDSEILAGAIANRVVLLWQVRKVGLPQVFSVPNSIMPSTLAPAEGQSTEYQSTILIRGIRELLGLKRTKSSQTSQISLNQASVNGIMSVAFSPSGKTLVCGSADNTIKVWNIKEERLSQTLQGHLGLVNTVAFSPDGKTLASGSSDKTIRLWRIK